MFAVRLVLRSQAKDACSASDVFRTLLITLSFVLFANATRAAIEADIACCYAPSYASSVGGDENAQVLLANAVIGNNRINDQSGTGARMRIAGFYKSVNDPINWTTTGGMVGWLSSYDSRVSDVVDYGTAVGADLVTYVCQNSDSGSIAAVAQEPGMYSALNPGAVWYVVLAHEVGGHNYGRTHNDGLVNPKTVMLHNYCGGGAASPYFFTNPRIWFNGIQLAGDTANNCSMGSLVNGGDNSAPSPQSVADRRTRVISGPNLNDVVLHWSFTNAPGAAPAGTTNLDLVSGSPAVVRGVGATYTGSGLRIPGGGNGNVAADSIAAYIDLPNGIIAAHTNLTLEIWATPLAADYMMRLCSFGKTSDAGDGLGAPGEWTGTPGTPAPGATTPTDEFMLSFCQGADLNQQRFKGLATGYGNYSIVSGLLTLAGVPQHYAITYEQGVGVNGATGGRLTWYRNGDPITYLDVNFRLSNLMDVNNWLGRSLWSANDSMTSAEYAEVRISNVALTRGEVLANCLLGPNYVPTATVTLTDSDAYGTTSFNVAGHWSDGAAPAGGNSYETFAYTLRTPAASGAYTFGGDSLKLSGGSLLFKGTSSSTITVANLILNGGTVAHAGSGTFNLAGDLSVTTNGGTINAVNGATTVGAGISGGGPLTYVGNATTLVGNNAGFTGKTLIGNGATGTLVINSQARLGANPATFTPDQLTLNRGTLQTTATLSLDDTHRGVLLDVSGGTFNVAAGTALTLATALSSPATAANVVAGALTKSGGGTLILISPGNGFKGTLFVDTASTTSSDGIVRVANNEVLAGAHSPIFIRNNTGGSASSMLQLDGSTGGITLPQAISLNGRNSGVAAIQNLAGTNMICGGITLNAGGSFYLIQSAAGLLSLGGTFSSSTTGARTLTFQGNGDFDVSGVINNGSATALNLTKTGAGVLTLGGANTYTGSTTVSQGAVRLQPATLLHLTFDNPAGSTSGSIVTNTGWAGDSMNGVIVGTGATIVSGGRYGNALSINGTASYVVISNAVTALDCNAGGASWTYALWIKTATAGAKYGYQGNGNWNSGAQTTFYLNNNNTSAGGTHAGGVRYGDNWLTGSAVINNNTWRFIAITVNGGIKTIYVDGAVDAQIGTTGWTAAGSASANQFWIGGSPNTGDGTAYLNGLIDEVYVFNRALTQPEVQSLMNNNTITNDVAPVLPVMSPVTVASGALLDLNGNSQTLASLAGTGTVTNTAGTAATLTVSNSAGTVTFSGSIGDTSPANALSLVKSGNSTTILAGANDYHGATTINGGSLFVNGSIASGAVAVAGGTLGGNGTINGPVTVQAGGTLSPGTSIGALTINHTLLLAGTTIMEIDKTGGTNDLVQGLTGVSYGGTLTILNLGGTLAAGDTFRLFSSTSYGGTFSVVNLPTLNDGLVWTNRLMQDGTLAVVSAVSMVPTNISFSASPAGLTLSWPEDHIGWRLLVQTNRVQSGLSLDTNDWAAVPGSELTNQATLPIDLARPAEFFRLVYP
jgi:autotransporter-associated beta strand protein